MRDVNSPAIRHPLDRYRSPMKILLLTRIN